MPAPVPRRKRLDSAPPPWTPGGPSIAGNSWPGAPAAPAAPARGSATTSTGTCIRGKGTTPANSAPTAGDRTSISRHSVFSTGNEAALKAAAGPQIVPVYGIDFRSTPIAFLQDDHDHWENDAVTDEITNFRGVSSSSRAPRSSFTIPSYCPTPRRCSASIRRRSSLPAACKPGAPNSNNTSAETEIRVTSLMRDERIASNQYPENAMVVQDVVRGRGRLARAAAVCGGTSIGRSI